MLNQKRWLPILLPGLLICSTEPLLSQSTVPHSRQSDHIITQVSFKPPPNNPQPRKTAGAGSRQEGECFSQTPSPSLPLIALAPTTHYGLTQAAHPTFFVYLPKTSAKHLILSIREDGTRHHSRTDLSLNQTSGIIQIRPSASSPPLAVGKTYQWSMVLVCGAKPGPNDPAVFSWIQRIDASSAQLDHKTALQKASWYGEHGLWYDTLMALAQAQQIQPHQQQITAIWTNFLTSVGLGAIANQPLFPSTPIP